jgi:uncharacterized membrane protein
MAIQRLRLKYNPPSHRAHIGHARGKGKRTPPDSAFEAPGRKLPRRLRSSLRRASQAAPRCGRADPKVRNRKPVSLGSALGGNGEVDRAQAVSARLDNLIKLPIQRVPVEQVEATMAAKESPDNSPVRATRRTLAPRWGNFN